MKIARNITTAMVFVSLAFAASAQSWLTDGLVAYYPFNGNANDVSGNGNDGTVNGAVLTQDRREISNSAYSFNGSSSKITFSSPPLTQVDNWTISAWINPANLSQSGFPVLVGFDDGFTGNGYGFGFVGSSTWQGIFSGVAVLNTSYSMPATNRWYHVVMLRTAGITKFFVDGAQTPNTTTLAPWSPTAFSIGARTSDGFFNGQVDDVRLYNRALSASEVQQLFAIEAFCSPHRATATAQVVNGFVVGATITDNGCGYTNSPLVLIQGGGGTGATAVAVVTNGVVVAINITSTGCCYTNLPKILIASPPFVPTVGIHVSRVNVVQRVMLGRNYLLESSSDLASWSPTGPPFTAQSEEITTEFTVSQTGQFFRIREVP